VQIVFLDPIPALILYVGLWLFFQVFFALACLKAPASWLDASRGFWKPRAWERNGAFYKKWFGANRWKKYLPDGGAVVRNGYRKKRIEETSRENLDRFLVESCRAELAHWLSIPPFVVFGFFGPPVVLPIMFLYALVLNAPCIIAQRYNRPRLLAIREGLDASGRAYPNVPHRVRGRRR
jgi:glycosyl-4,4'-diaponeurosporenoate acyltransferase